MKSNQERLDEIHELITKLETTMPEQIDAFNKFMFATEKSTALDAKHKELINVALSISAQCEWCIALHVKGAISAGATKQEILEAAMEAVLMHGGPALMYMIPVENAIEEFTEN
jgi:AhpD family alkylhydroperoxidase